MDAAAAPGWIARGSSIVAVMQDGCIVASGPPEQVLTEARIRDVFGVESTIETDDDGTCLIRFLAPRSHRRQPRTRIPQVTARRA